MYIRFQGNTIPNHCVYWGDFQGASAPVDFKVKFQPPKGAQVAFEPTTQDELDQLICSFTRTNFIPSTSDYTSYAVTSLQGFVGASLVGALFSTSIASTTIKVDPAYPTIYDTLTNPIDAKAFTDSCMTSLGLYGN